MNKRQANKLHKLALSGLSWEEYRRRVPIEREKSAEKRWRKQFPVNSLGRYWMPIHRILEANSLKDMVKIDDQKFIFQMEYSYGQND